jgi:hypothetical protein
MKDPSSARDCFEGLLGNKEFSVFPDSSSFWRNERSASPDFGAGIGKGRHRMD